MLLFFMVYTTAVGVWERKWGGVPTACTEAEYQER